MDQAVEAEAEMPLVKQVGVETHHQLVHHKVVMEEQAEVHLLTNKVVEVVEQQLLEQMLLQVKVDQVEQEQQLQ